MLIDPNRDPAREDLIAKTSDDISIKSYNYTVDRHVGPRGLRHLTFEIRQDLLADKTHVQHWADQLEPLLRELMSGPRCAP